MTRRRCLGPLCALALLAAPAGAGEATLIDFEQGKLGEQWTAEGALRAEGADLPAAALAALPTAGDGARPAGRGLHLTASGRAVLSTRAEVIPADWTASEALVLWVYRDAQVAARQPTVVLEVQLVERDLAARLWRKVVLDHTGWRRVELRLGWFRPAGLRVPDLTRISALRLFLREEQELWIDGIARREGRPGSAYLQPEEVGAVAFPASPHREAACEPVRVLTDSPELDGLALASELERLAGALEDALRRKPPPRRPVCVVVFARPEDYRGFPQRLGERLLAAADPPAHDGFTPFGIATSTYDPAQGARRPVYAHEFVHAWLVAAGIDGGGDWLHEGLAALFQQRLHPQENAGRIVSSGLEAPVGEGRLPLAELIDGRQLATSLYWQAMSLCELLLHDPAYRPKLPALLEALLAADSASLLPHLQPVLGVDLQRLEADWRRRCAETWQR